MSLDRNELHAWVDGRLDGERLRRFERLLEADETLFEEAHAWRRQALAVRAFGRRLLDEPVPERFAETVRRQAIAGGSAAVAAFPSPSTYHSKPARRRLGLAAAVLAAFAWSLGWWMHDRLAPETTRLVDGGPPPFVRDAVAAHVVYAPEVRHPVEVAAEQHDHLVSWLSKRLGAALTVPSLESHGWSLVGGRLLPGADGARAQFMYQDASGERLTLYVADVGESSRDTAFRFDGAGPVSVFYWVDGRFGYTLSAPADRRTLLALAEDVYRQSSIRYNR